MIHMSLMEFRYDHLATTLQALRETGVSLLEKRGDLYGVAGAGDDPGIYYFVPHLALWTGWDLQTAVNVFLLGLLGGGLALALAAFIKRRVHPLALLAAALTLGYVTRLAYLFSDVYLAQVTAVFAVVPFLLLRRDTDKPSRALIGGALLAGVLWGTLNGVRSQAGVGSLLFLLLWTFNRPRWSLAWRTALVAVALGGMLMPTLYYRHLETQRNDWLANRQPGQFTQLDPGHSFWHSVYIGFGYLPNPYGLEYRDKVAYDLVAQADPAVVPFTPRYHAILREAVFDFAGNHPWFVLRTFAAKALVLLGWVLPLALPGLFFLWAGAPPGRPWLPLLGSAAFYALPGILVYPSKNYVFGLLALGAVLGACGVAWGLKEGGLRGWADRARH